MGLVRIHGAIYHTINAAIESMLVILHHPERFRFHESRSPSCLMISIPDHVGVDSARWVRSLLPTSALPALGYRRAVLMYS